MSSSKTIVNLAALMEIPDGTAGIRETLKRMKAIALAASRNPQLRSLAIQITSTLQSKDFAGEIAAIFDYVKSNIRFVQDIEGCETLQWPRVTLGFRAGDCDDHSILLAAALTSIGYLCRFSALAFEPQGFEHVITEVECEGTWVCLDTTEDEPMGWRPPDIWEELQIYVTSGAD